MTHFSQAVVAVWSWVWQRKAKWRELNHTKRHTKPPSSRKGICKAIIAASILNADHLKCSKQVRNHPWSPLMAATRIWSPPYRSFGLDPSSSCPRKANRTEFLFELVCRLSKYSKETSHLPNFIPIKKESGQGFANIESFGASSFIKTVHCG